MTVGHLFDDNLNGTCFAYKKNRKDSYLVGRPVYKAGNIDIPPGGMGLDRITADIALLQLLPTCGYFDNRISIKNENGFTRRFQLTLHKGDIFNLSKVMIVNRNKELKYGHIKNTMFTDKDTYLYNTITIVDSDKSGSTTITEQGDSGALVMQSQDVVNCSNPDVSVYGMVTGIFTVTSIYRPVETMTVANRLWDVLKYWNIVDNTETVDFGTEGPDGL